MKTVQISFAGPRSEDMARRFYTFLVDGGLEDYLIQQLTTPTVTMELNDCNNEDLTVLFQCRESKGKVTHLKSVT